MEIEGRNEEIFATHMKSDELVHQMHADRNNVTLEGQAQVKNYYRIWDETNQAMFYVDNEEFAVADHFIATVSTVLQQISGKALTPKSFRAGQSEM